MAVGKEPKGADAHEAARQHMQKESANELLCGNCHLTLFIAVSVITPSECDVFSIERQQTMV